MKSCPNFVKDPGHSVHGQIREMPSGYPRMAVKNFIKVTTFALASKLLQLRTFKCQKWKAGTLAVRSYVPLFFRDPKLDSGELPKVDKLHLTERPW